MERDARGLLVRVLLARDSRAILARYVAAYLANPHVRALTKLRWLAAHSLGAV